LLPKGRKNFLTVYPNIQLSVKDTEDPQTHAPIVATAEMLNAANGKSRLGCTVAAKFSRQFSDEVSWQKASRMYHQVLYWQPYDRRRLPLAV